MTVTGNQMKVGTVVVFHQCQQKRVQSNWRWCCLMVDDFSSTTGSGGAGTGYVATGAVEIGQRANTSIQRIIDNGNGRSISALVDGRASPNTPISNKSTIVFAATTAGADATAGHVIGETGSTILLQTHWQHCANSTLPT
mmetsp:Transcript_15297/g.23704  ORF Transcript_15297/g.23704 Transcript_15297/m.23704 type:complete len:140 (+) Transcript_15297:503-922(+)